jgi:hypothetical protein
MNLDDKKWDSYFKFTFIRNPYDRFVSAFKYLKQYHSKNCDYETLEEFIHNMHKICRYSYFHLFITQFENLRNDQGIDHLQAIGRFESLENDLCRILRQIGFEDTTRHHSIREKKFHPASDTRPTWMFLTPATLTFCNQYFEKDFKVFHYNRYRSIEAMKNKKTSSPLYIICIFILLFLGLFFLLRQHARWP